MPKNPEIILGGGGEKQVYEDKIDPLKVTAEFPDAVQDLNTGNSDYKPNQIKGAYYLGKIAKLLFPDAVAEHYAAGMKPLPFLRISKLELDSDHVEYQESLRTPTELAERLENRLPGIQALTKTMNKAGLRIDDMPHNFSYSPEGHLQYVDAKLPWRVEVMDPFTKKQSVELHFSPTKLKRAIENLPQPQQKIAMRYYERLIKLHSEEKKIIKQENRKI